jgi:signal transduction histidine kinase
MTIETPTTAVDGSQARSPRTPDVMTDHDPGGLPPQPPTVPAPRPFVDRRESHRRTEDRVAHQEKVLLARALDILASDAPAEERVAGILRLLARTVGARRAAVVADGIERRAAVAVDPGEDPAEAQELAAWLDANAPRSRAERAATGLAPISFIVGAADHRHGGRANGSAAAGHGSAPAAPRPQPLRSAGPEPVAGDRPATDDSSSKPVPPADRADRHYAMLPIPTAGGVVLGFAFARAADARHLPDRLPPTMARHAGVALALVTGQLAGERDLASLQVRETERSKFVSTVAHELRTPLTGLRGYLELILEGEVPDAADERDFLERSRSIVSTMDELVGDLLELSRLESNSIRLEIGPFSIAEAASQVASNLLPIAIDREIRLTTALPPRLRAATGDRRRVEQILTNLAANALKFTPRGGTVEIIGRVEGLAAVFIVRDDGDGVPAEDRDRIFQPFQRLAGHHGVTGTGLGLPIARDLARRMGGDLDLASVADSGSAFVLVLPGPADVDARVIGGTLSQALEREEIGLEERAVRRAMGLLPGGAPAHPGTTRRSSVTESAMPTDESGTANGRAGEDEHGPNGLHHPKLRALPSVRDDRPSPA